MYKTVLLFILILAVSAYADDPDLTPSINFFAIDYATYSMTSAQDSIIAGRYDAFLADASYGAGFVTRYNLFYAHRPSRIEYYVYDNFNNPLSSVATLEAKNTFIGALMVEDAEDSADMYWHSLDSTQTSFGYLLPYADSEMGSRVTTYSGARYLVNNTNLDFIKHYKTWAYQIDTLYSSTRDYTIAGIWFDNMGTPSTCDRTAADQGYPKGCMYENTLDSSIQFGGEGNLTWQQNYADTVLIKYTGIVAESLATISLKVNMNALGFGSALLENYAYGWNPKEMSGVLVAPANRTFEFWGNTYSNREFFETGPTDAATDIDAAVVGDDFTPVDLYDSMVTCANQGVENWWNPAEVGVPYGFKKRWYDFLAGYYLVKTSTAYLYFNANYLGQVTNDLNGWDPDAGLANDTCYWIDACSVYVGRLDTSSLWDADTVYWYAASVTCTSCVIETGAGKDDIGNNWVVFSRQWSGDDNYDYLVLLRPNHRYSDDLAGTDAPPFALPTGSWTKMDEDGAWGSGITEDSLRSGEGGIYRQATAGASGGARVIFR